MGKQIGGMLVVAVGVAVGMIIYALVGKKLTGG